MEILVSLSNKSENEINIINMYIDGFFLASNTIITLTAIKNSLVKEYNINDLSKIKMIIR